MIVRLYRDTDREAVVDLWRRVFPDDPPRNDPTGIVERKRSVQPELFLVGEDEERVIAALIGGYDGMRGWLYHLAVEPSARRQGHGRTLVAAVPRRDEEKLTRRVKPDPAELSRACQTESAPTVM